MSAKLVVEFYHQEDLTRPIACVLACHGGDNPSSAAATLSEFFDAVSSLDQPRFNDVGLLAARFVAWESRKGTDSNHIDFVDVALFPFQQKYGYQIARVYAHEGRPYVHCVRDEWTSGQELLEAATILHQSSVDEPEMVLNN